MSEVEDNSPEQVDPEAETAAEKLPVDASRPIFNSLIDSEESSRYLRDMMK